MKLGTLALKVLGFFAFVFAFWKWGETSAKLKDAERIADEAIEESERVSENNSISYVDSPAMCLYDSAEDTEQDNKIPLSKKATYDKTYEDGRDG